MKVLKTVVNTELVKLYDWFTSNKLTLNIFLVNPIHLKRKKPNYQPKICLFDDGKNEYATLESKKNIKYLGILINKNLIYYLETSYR